MIPEPSHPVPAVAPADPAATQPSPTVPSAASATSASTGPQGLVPAGGDVPTSVGNGAPRRAVEPLPDPEPTRGRVHWSVVPIAILLTIAVVLLVERFFL